VTDALNFLWGNICAGFYWFSWYWIADLCEDHGIDFVLGHALYMKAIHGGKAKNDRIDSLKIATLLRGGLFPLAYVYPGLMKMFPMTLSKAIPFLFLIGITT
jgi:hypothetical protein